MIAPCRLFADGNSCLHSTRRAAPFRLGLRSKQYSGSSRRLAGVGGTFSFMPHAFAEYEPELEPQGSSARGGGPPRKLTGIGVLDPPSPPKRPLGPIPSSPTGLIWRIAAA